MKNIYYFKSINKLGGTEQFLYEIAKKYKDYDVTIYYDEADETQLQRLTNLVRCKKRKPNEFVKCDRAFYNFNIDMIDQVEANEHIFVSHAIYQELGYQPPIKHPKLTRFIGVSKYSCDKLEEFGRKIGRPIKAELCYNPLTLEPKQKILHLVSASRLNDSTKGGKRILNFIRRLDNYCEQNNRNYIWHIFSDMSGTINSPNVAIMRPRIDVRPYIADADFCVQLSNNMETYCYTINEALAYGVPVVTTPLEVLKELNIPKKALLICDWEMSNADEVIKNMFEKEITEFEYIPPKDNWNNLLIKGKSTYQDELKKRYLVQALDIYQELNIVDNELGRVPQKNEQWEVSKQRLDKLLGDNNEEFVYVKLIKEVKEGK